MIPGGILHQMPGESIFDRLFDLPRPIAEAPSAIPCHGGSLGELSAGSDPRCVGKGG